MFSSKGVPLGEDTLEYAWLMEIQCGVLKGKLTPLQVTSSSLITIEDSIFIDCIPAFFIEFPRIFTNNPPKNLV